MLCPEGNWHAVVLPGGDRCTECSSREGTQHGGLSTDGTEASASPREGILHGVLSPVGSQPEPRVRCAEGARHGLFCPEGNRHGVFCPDGVLHGMLLREGTHHGGLSTGADYTGRFHLSLSIPRLAAGELCRLGIAAASRVCHSR